MSDKSTVTLWPPEHGVEPHIPIELHPSQVEGMKAQGWRDNDPNPKPETAKAEDPPSAEDPPAGKKKKKEKVQRSDPPMDSPTA